MKLSVLIFTSGKMEVLIFGKNTDFGCLNVIKNGLLLLIRKNLSEEFVLLNLSHKTPLLSSM